ncbi:MAG: hypothetical protein LBO03_06655 [Acidaminococcales bacterium]|nr:hypothetical protein [Acidaminococcales bacterium]
MPVFNPVLGHINKKEMLRYAGMRQSEDLPHAVIAAAAEDALVYARPAGAWEIYDYQAPALKIPGGDYLPQSLKLCAHLRGAVKVAVLAVSVGGDIETRVNQLFAAGEYTKALLLDAAADSAVEQAADSLCAFVASSVRALGLGAGRRFSPGYGDWDIKEQPRILELSGAARIGLGATKSFMLAPRKSITAALGLGFSMLPGKAGDACLYCENAGCRLRRAKNDVEDV